MKAFRDSSSNLGLFVQLFNSENVMKEHFPKTYEAYKNTCQGIEDSLSSQREEYYEINIIHAAYEDAQRNTLVVTLQADAGDQKGYCILEGTASNTKTGEILTPCAESNFLGDGEIIDVRIPMEGCNLEDIQLSAMLYTVDEHVNLYQWEEYLDGYLLEAGGGLKPEMIDPVLKHTNKENRDINIAYYLNVGIKEDCLDYHYERAEMEGGFVRIPSEGSFIVKDTIITSATASLSARNSQKKQFYHYNPEVHAVPQGTGTKISWKMDTCWRDVKVKDLIINLYEYVDYTLSITAISSAKRISFEITNRECAPTEHRYVFEKIYIYRDCFLEDTVITMADGSKRKIQDLKKGELVKTGSQGTSAVQEVLFFERMDSVAHIQMADGTELFLTSNHPLKTKDGFCCAFLLENGEEIETEQGFVAVSQVCAAPEHSCKLVSVELEGEHQFYANGILAADSSREAAETAKALNMRYQVQEAWRKDYDGWQMRNEGRTNVKQCWENLPD